MQESAGNDPVPRWKAGFTLIELLSVIAIIAVLAALLLPALAAAKTRAKEVQCRCNLKQLAYALTMYVDDWGRFPGAWRLPNTFSYNPELGGPIVPCHPIDEVYFQLYDYLGVPDRRRGEVGVWFREPFVWNCPAVAATNLPNLLTGAADRRFIANYGYNSAGTARSAADIDLGLCPMLVEPAMRLEELPARYVREITWAGVLVPADMVAFGDDRQWMDDEISPFPVLQDGHPAPLGDRHRRGANGAFCDAHVEYRKSAGWCAATDEARASWNLDHQPHRETWK